jgi:hypothetical protein
MIPAVVRIRRRLIFEGDCLVYTGQLTNLGYGKIKTSGRTQSVHRVWWLSHGREIPSGLELDHLCKNRRCICLDHLEVVTHRENVLRGNSPPARNARKRVCWRGHKLTVKHDSERHCLECTKIQYRQRALANKEKKREYYLANRERILSKAKEWRERNPKYMARYAKKRKRLIKQSLQVGRRPLHGDDC